MTPISFALEILLDCTTIEQAHKRCRRYIKELEKQPNVTAQLPQRAVMITPQIAQQAPSTQRLMAEHGPEPHQQSPVITTIKIQPATIDKETGRPQVQTGNGTAGPRKW